MSSPARLSSSCWRRTGKLTVADACWTKNRTNLLIFTSSLLLISVVPLFVYGFSVIVFARQLNLSAAFSLSLSAVFTYHSVKLVRNLYLARRENRAFFNKKEIVAVLWSGEELDSTVKKVAKSFLSTIKTFDSTANLLYFLAVAIMFGNTINVFSSGTQQFTEALQFSTFVLVLVATGWVYHSLAYPLMEICWDKEGKITRAGTFKAACISVVSLDAILLGAWFVVSYEITPEKLLEYYNKNQLLVAVLIFLLFLQAVKKIVSNFKRRY